MVTKFDHNLVVSENVELVNCQLLVGAKHLEDKLSVIAKNSSPNASPVQLSVVSCQLFVVRCQLFVVSCSLSVPFLSNTDNP